MKTIGWAGCFGFALLSLFQHCVICTMEQSYYESAKMSEPIIIDRSSSTKELKTITIWTKDNFDRLINFGNCTY